MTESGNTTDADSFSSRALRQARVDLLFKDYEVCVQCLSVCCQFCLIAFCPRLIVFHLQLRLGDGLDLG